MLDTQCRIQDHRAECLGALLHVEAWNPYWRGRFRYG